MSDCTLRLSAARKGKRIVAALSLLAASMLPMQGASAVVAARDDRDVQSRIAGVRLPFIANEGQTDGRVAYYAPTFAGTSFVTRRGEIVHALSAPRTDAKRGRGRSSSSPRWSLTETLRGGHARPVAQERSTAGISSFLGNDPARWRSALPTWEQVSLGEVWPGVTVVLRARGRSMEKVFTVHPGAAVGRIRVAVAGAHALTVNGDGALVARTGLGAVTFTAPVAFQEVDGVRHPVTVAYRQRGLEYGFRAGAYDPTRPLVIDPLLQSTYLGGSGGDVAYAVGIHPTTGDVYVAGGTNSANFPGTAGGAQPAAASSTDAYIARLPSTLTSFIQVTYLGGGANTAVVPDDEIDALAFHPTTGDVYVAGQTGSDNFPGTAGGAQPAFGGGGTDAFIARLPRTLTSLTQATYLGNNSANGAYALKIHPTTGDVYVAGYTGSSTLIARLPSTLTAFTFAGEFGGQSQANALAIHPTTGDVYVAGFTASSSFPGTAGGAQPTFGGGSDDAFVARLPSTMTSITQATYLGGTGGNETATALAIHPTTGDVYVGGLTDSANFPGTAGGAQSTLLTNSGFVVSNGFIARLPSTLTSLTQATYLRGSFGDLVWALAIHPTTGDVYAAGQTSAANFPGATGGAQPASGGFNDAFIARLPRTLTSLTQATHLGGSDDEAVFGLALAIHPTTGDIYVAGDTQSSNFPGTPGGAQPTRGGLADAFVARLTAPLTAVDPRPDLTVAKSHTGHFYRGQVGATYTLTVTNAGPGVTIGTVTVTDTLPSGLTATALGGPGWSCTLGTLTCTRNDALANGANYPLITLTVDVAANASSSVTNTATVSGGNDVTPGNNTGNDPTSVTRFADVGPAHPFLQWIEALSAAMITGGCAVTPPQYCPDQGVTRGQMAVFLLRGIHGAGYAPPNATGMFTDVPATPPAHPFVTWIEELAREAITTGCGPSLYCPEDIVTRGQMAVFLLRAKHGAGYPPPDATGMFTDVPIGSAFAKFIEELAREGITGGCGPSLYCPDGPVTRGQMAVFLVRAFNLPL